LESHSPVLTQRIGHCSPSADGTPVQNPGAQESVGSPRVRVPSRHVCEGFHTFSEKSFTPGYSERTTEPAGSPACSRATAVSTASLSTLSTVTFTMWSNERSNIG
jgi:hypothetical protein